jgi:hypothetical protein
MNFAASGGEAVLTRERRNRERIHFQAPATASVGQHSIAASTKDISDRGLFFFTDASFEIGSQIDLVVLLPEKTQLPISGMVCCHGRVVRVDSSGGQQYGIGVEIDRLTPVQQI